MRFAFLFILLIGSTNALAQDTLVIDDQSIWWLPSSCSPDPRCFKNIDEIVTELNLDSTKSIVIILEENVYEKASKVYTECRLESLQAYLQNRKGVIVSEIFPKSIRLDREEMREAMLENNYRTIRIISQPIN